MKNGLVTDTDGNKFWYLNDKLHRIDGPAIEYADGRRYWYLDGRLVTPFGWKKDGISVKPIGWEKEGGIIIAACKTEV